MTFPIEIIHGIRKELGPKYPIIFRLSADEFIDGGMNLEESKKVAKILEDAGIDALDVSAGTYDSMPTMIEPMSYAQGWKIYLAESIKKVVKIPVIGVGVIRTPEFAEEILKDKNVDFVALGRALLADPYWPQKAREGREVDITPCISCNNGCIGRIFRNLHIRCASNPLTGREKLKHFLVPVSKKKKVFVIGGGPGGMVAALTADMRGHEVTLFEKSDQLGGQLRLAAKPPGNEKIAWYLDYLLNQIKRRRIKISLGRLVTQENIIQSNPDAIILAVGSIPLMPDIQGIKSRLVYSSKEILEGKEEIKDKVVLVLGSGTIVCETALYLASHSKEVIMIEMLDGIAMDMEPINRTDHISRIQESKIKVFLGAKIERIEPDGVVLFNQGMIENRVKVDVVVIAMGATPANDLVKSLKGKVPEIYVVGDCHQPRKIIDAVYEGFLSAIRL
jgi:NADPH-dependent 2,4-dienoyl-CoA reductase/sulfur reductase-like enzyme